jgi:hypothetical protein
VVTKEQGVFALSAEMKRPILISKEQIKQEIAVTGRYWFNAGAAKSPRYCATWSKIFCAC